jgi:hypothetical protein
MTSDYEWENFKPKVNNWFSTRIEYTGTGRAEFTNPKGWVEGEVNVQVDETGEISISMEVDPDKFYCECSLGLENRMGDLDWLLDGRKPSVIGSAVMSGGDLNPKNTCTKLFLRTDAGSFEILDINILYFAIHHKIQFWPHLCHFEANTTQRAKYWVLPLSNLIAYPFSIPGDHPFLRHPLRFFPTLTDNLSDEEKQHLLFLWNNSNNLVLFKSGRSLSFMEPLIDFEERKDRLENHQANNLITAVMVGRVGGKSIDFVQAIEWLPIDSIDLLSLATGTLVGIPWIEFRDANGHLVKRLHVGPIGQSDYHKGHAAIDVRRLGQLLTQAPHELTPSLRVAIRHTVRGSNKGLGREDNFSHLVRALDTLCQASSLASSSIDPSRLIAIKQITKDASAAIRQVAEQAKAAGSLDEEKTIRNIVAQRVSTATNFEQRPKFDEAISLLLDNAKLPDAYIVESFYKVTLRLDTRETLPAVLSMYRARSIHDNYFVLSDGTHDPRDITRIQRHLHDILLRLILKKLNYTGVYHSPIARGGEVPLDWVKPDTPASELGY